MTILGELLRGTPVDLDINSAAPVAEIARRMRVSGITGRAAREGTLVVERRWTVASLPDDELLDALAHCYGVVASILDEAHDQLGTSIATCEISAGNPFGWTKAYAHPDGRPGCMWASREARTSRRALWHRSSCACEVTSASLPDIRLKEVQDRYSLTSQEPIAENADIFDKARIFHRKKSHHAGHRQGARHDRLAVSRWRAAHTA